MSKLVALNDKQLEEVRQMFTPFGSRVVIAIDDFKYEGLITIPETAKRLPTTGIVVALGSGFDENNPCVCAVGDRVLITAYSGTLVMISQKPAFRVCDAGEILGKIHKDSTLEYAGG